MNNLNYLLDSDPMTLLERGGPEASNLRARLLVIDAEAYDTTIITYEEQMRGWLSYIARRNKADDLILAYSRLQSHIEMFFDFKIIQFDAPAAEFERLRGLKLRVGTQDLKIAAIVLANDATLLTRNRQDFAKIPGLRAEDWPA